MTHLPQFPRILFAKVAWADLYEGDELVAGHGFVQEHNDGHERFNFKASPDGRYYGYLMPQANGCPAPRDRTGWLVIFVARWQGTGEFVPVGWYQNARILKGYRDRPEYPQFELDRTGDRYSYVLEADSHSDVHRIPPAERSAVTVPSAPRFVNAKFLYARGHGEWHPWRDEYLSVAERILTAFDVRSKAGVAPRPSFPVADMEVAGAAVTAVTEYFRRDPEVKAIADRQRDNCGYDLLVHRFDGRDWHIEVKGTKSDRPHFYMSRNEYHYRGDPRWRLAIVTDALRAPRIDILSLSDVDSQFRFVPIMWEGVERT